MEENGAGKHICTPTFKSVRERGGFCAKKNVKEARYRTWVFFFTRVKKVCLSLFMFKFNEYASSQFLHFTPLK
jgi:hypothetical protein